MEEVKHYKVKTLPYQTKPNSIYYVKNTSEDSVKTYITDLNGVPIPLIDQTGGSGSGDKEHIHIQYTPTNIWVINHDLDKYVSVSIVDSDNNLVIGDVQYNNRNTITVTFQVPFSGKAYIN